MTYCFTVICTPAPQGSKRHVGRGILVESSALVKPWREAVVYAAREKNIRVPGPVSVRVVFTIRKPISAPKRRKTYPDRKPDLDKLLRSTLDALVQAGAIEDDARVIRLSSSKVFPREDPMALDTPGAFIEIGEVA